MCDIAANDYDLCPAVMVLIVLPKSHKLGVVVSFGPSQSQFDCTLSDQRANFLHEPRLYDFRRAERNLFSSLRRQCTICPAWSGREILVTLGQMNGAHRQPRGGICGRLLVCAWNWLCAVQDRNVGAAESGQGFRSCQHSSPDGIRMPDARLLSLHSCH